MIRYKLTTFMEHKMPGLKPIANDKLLFAYLYCLQYVCLWCQLCIKENFHKFLKTYS